MHKNHCNTSRLQWPWVIVTLFYCAVVLHLLSVSHHPQLWMTSTVPYVCWWTACSSVWRLWSLMLLLRYRYVTSATEGSAHAWVHRGPQVLLKCTQQECWVWKWNGCAPPCDRSPFKNCFGDILLPKWKIWYHGHECVTPDGTIKIPNFLV